MKEQKRGISLKWVYFVFGILIITMLIWTSLKAIRESPTREVSVQLPDLGFVTFSLTTDPYPPLPTGNVRLLLNTRNSRGVMFSMENAIPFSFGLVRSDETLGSGEVNLSSSTYQASVAFPVPGNYWIDFRLPGGEIVQFKINVASAQ